MKYVSNRKAFLIVFFVGIGAIFYLTTYSTNKSPVYKPFQLGNVGKYNLYKDSQVGFSFMYDKKYRLQTDRENTIGFQYANNNLENSIVVIEINNPTVEDLLQYAINKYTQWLEGEWSGIKFDTSRYDRRITGSKYYTFINPFGIKGYEVYLESEIVNVSKGKIEKRDVWGPLFILEISKESTNITHAIFAHAFMDPTSDQISILKTFVNSFQLKPN